MVRALALLVVLGAGCLRNAAFPCSQDLDCARGGESGVCESTGFCSFVDTTCPDGRRYGDLSGGFAGECVTGSSPSDGSVDSPTDTVDSSTDGPQAAPFCDSAGEATLVGCWEFENTFADASGDGNNATTAGNVTFVAGQVGQAMQQDGTGHVTVADSASMSPGSLTIEAWISPSIVSGSRMGILDNQNSYGFFITPNSAGLQCTNVTVAMAISINTFTHVACTYEANVGSHLYINGVDVATGAAAAALGAGSADGSVIGGDSPGPGDPLVGKIDQMRVWNVARTADQICRAAGRTPPCT